MKCICDFFIKSILHFFFKDDFKFYQSGINSNDSYNDFLVFEELDYFPDNYVCIYSSSGNKVFETTRYNTNKNVFRGYLFFNKKAKLPVGFYFYIIHYKDNESIIGNKTGYIYLNH